jgi:hypothetical protein
MCAVLALVSPRVFAATINVLPGQSIQAAVNAATAGDQLIIAAGAYTEDLTINKNLDFRREAGTTVHMSGNVTFSGITGAFVFAHFRVGSDATKSLTIINCQNVFLEDVNASGGGGLSTTGSTVYAYDCSFGNAIFTTSNWTLQECVISGDVTSNSSDTKVLRCTINGNLAHNTTGTHTCTVFQSTISTTAGTSLTTVAKRSWIGYNTMKSLVISGDAEEAEVVGNLIDKGNDPSNHGYIVEVDAASLVATVRNNVMRNNYFSATGLYHGLYVRRGTKIRIHNNVFHSIRGNAVEVHADTGAVEIIGNFFARIQYGYAVNAPFEVGGCYYNWVYDRYGYMSNPHYAGGVASSDNLEGDPKFVTFPSSNNTLPTTANTDYHLQGTSPLKNAGSPLPEFKDHDGTRHDIGLYGGHHYDPEGTTADRPVILSAELAPKRIYNGGTTTIKIKSRAVVSTPKQ